jgi:hypothetical protein
MAGCVAAAGLLPDAQALARTDNRVVGCQPLHAGLLRGPLLHVVHAAHADGHAQQIAHELHHGVI